VQIKIISKANEEFAEMNTTHTSIPPILHYLLVKGKHQSVGYRAKVGLLFLELLKTGGEKKTNRLFQHSRLPSCSRPLLTMV